jgi:hypothetical protein
LRSQSVSAERSTAESRIRQVFELHFPLDRGAWAGFSACWGLCLGLTVVLSVCSRSREVDQAGARFAGVPVDSTGRRYGDRPHGGWRDSLESVPGSVGSIPRSAYWLHRQDSLLSGRCAQESAWGEGESPTAELAHLGGGEGQESIGLAVW